MGMRYGTVIIHQDGKVTIAGKTYDRFVTTFDRLSGLAPETSYSRLARDGIYSRKTTNPSSRDELEIPFPVQVGRKWIFNQDNLALNMEIAAIEDVDIAGKTYRRCLKLVGKGQRETDPPEVIFYHAPNVGLVRTSMTGPQFVMEMELRETQSSQRWEPHGLFDASEILSNNNVLLFSTGRVTRFFSDRHPEWLGWYQMTNGIWIWHLYGNDWQVLPSGDSLRMSDLGSPYFPWSGEPTNVFHLKPRASLPPGYDSGQ